MWSPTVKDSGQLITYQNIQKYNTITWLLKFDMLMKLQMAQVSLVVKEKKKSDTMIFPPVYSKDVQQDRKFFNRAGSIISE